MPTLLEDPARPTVDETLVEEFDLERLARISEAQPPIEPPRFELLEPAPKLRFGFRGKLVTALLAVVMVGGLATLGPAANQLLGASESACAVGD